VTEGAGCRGGRPCTIGEVKRGAGGSRGTRTNQVLHALGNVRLLEKDRATVKYFRHVSFMAR